MSRQRTEEWRMARLGKVTASKFDDALTASRCKDRPFGDTAMTYLYELVSQRLTNLLPVEFTGDAVMWGIANEDKALAAYQWETGRNVAGYGFVDHPTIKGVGGSSDGVVVNEDRIIEIKCPYTSKEHVRTAATGEVPKQYVAQVQGNLWITERASCDFISFDPRMPEHLQLVVLDVPRDEVFIEKLAERVTVFARLVDETEERLRNGSSN